MNPVRRLWTGLIRFGFRLLYNELAWIYDWVSVAVSWGQWRRWQRAAIPRLAGQRVLEVAFGTGDLLEDMAAARLAPFGLDLSPQMARIAAGKLRRKGLHVPLCQGRAEQLPFRSMAFDSAVATFPTPFIRMPVTLVEVARVLRPGGRLVIVDNGYLSSRLAPHRFINWLYAITGQRQPWPDMPDLLAQAGFSVQQQEDGDAVSSVQVVVGVKQQPADLM